jgi:hypothetical protein
LYRMNHRSSASVRRFWWYSITAEQQFPLFEIRNT